MNLSPHWRGHVLLFERKERPALDAKTALRLLVVFVVLEGLIGPRFEGPRLLGLPDPPALLRIAILFVLALLLVRFVARISFRRLGFLPWREWSATEKSYFLQVAVIFSVAGALLLGSRLRPEFFATALVWGFYQELVYRGILQMALVSRMGAVAGILLGNLLFTFGPLHFYHFFQAPPAVGMFAAIFAIGLFFAILFHRSGNLWIVAIFHGLGTAFILGGSGATSAL
jgi:membrane protease YdiL (CAAX protease family)